MGGTPCCCRGDRRGGSHLGSATYFMSRAQLRCARHNAVMVTATALLRLSRLISTEARSCSHQALVCNTTLTPIRE
ncbi:hypothetical protein ANN_08287 [Periplaneta americana]|uniref:Uncharacterized protein n=1 Tax=Periplaneta americana TaxID=6978 RepID=A0ABQ8T253_PERAM|nr:hypothetical protein ANN_08287 [Periplaneta americana]